MNDVLSRGRTRIHAHMSLMPGSVFSLTGCMCLLGIHRPQITPIACDMHIKPKTHTSWRPTLKSLVPVAGYLALAQDTGSWGPKTSSISQIQWKSGRHHGLHKSPGRIQNSMQQKETWLPGHGAFSIVNGFFLSCKKQAQSLMQRKPSNKCTK